MAKAPSDRQPADAAASARGMQDAGRQGPTDNRQNDDVAHAPPTKPTASASKDTSEITRRDVHTASSINAQRRFPKPITKEPNLAHQAVLRRVRGKDAAQNSIPESQSTANSRPVLVRTLSNSTDMKQKPKPTVKTSSPKLPALESFSFQDILASIGPEVNASIDAIAEICGRSKMSLAEEYSSHRPPQARLPTTDSSPASSAPPARLEPVAETSSSRPHTRSMSRSLAFATGQATDALASSSTIAISNVTSHTQIITSDSEDVPDSSISPPPAHLLPQILAWIHHTNPAFANDISDAPGRDVGAARALHKILDKAPSVQS
ncbi:hypothetical protein MMC28_009417 [Mycoblastus sanguinarius]|nr:hypothetical protein [Mycoblastus sanguinarius]